MIHSIEFKDVRDIVEKAKREAREADFEYDKEYSEYLQEKAIYDKKNAEWENKHNEDPTKYPEYTRPRKSYFRRDMEKRTKDSPYTDFLECSYINALESLNGKKFEFSPGLNVIVGSNGAGKTSLLKVIRTIFFCEGLRNSSLFDVPYWHFKVTNDVVPMLHMCDVIADYRRCAYNMLCERDINKNDPFSNGGAETFLQCYEGLHSSKGEKGVIALNMLLDQFREKCDLPIEDKNHPRGMAGNVMLYLIDAMARFSEETANDIREVVDYYKNHQKDDEKHPFIMDEPDSGFDVFKAQSLCNLLEKMANDSDRSIIQPIVVLHNVAIISRLMKNPKVHFIELTPGYMDAVRKFDI